MAEYNYESRNVDELLQSLYEKGLNRSKHLSDNEIKKILTTIGMFKFKGYCYAFKGVLSAYSIDDIFMLYFFDKYLTRIVMDLTSSIETKLKTVVVELCYEKLRNLPSGNKNKNNPFFYLINRKNELDLKSIMSLSEIGNHYILVMVKNLILIMDFIIKINMIFQKIKIGMLVTKQLLNCMTILIILLSII